MFKVQPGSQSEINEAAVQAAVSGVKFPERTQEQKLIWSEQDWLNLKQKWESFKGPVRDVTSFAIAEEYGVTNQDTQLYTIIEYRDGELDVYIEDEEYLEEFGDLFTVVNKIKSIKGTKQTPSNSRCPCGSGKKFKKCNCKKNYCGEAQEDAAGRCLSVGQIQKAKHLGQ